MDLSIVISTFGSYRWQLLAQERAIPSARSFGIPVIYNHGKSLHETRNEGLFQVETEWVCHLDADDELAPGFFDAMGQVEGDLRVPSVQYVPFPARMPNVPGHSHRCVADCLLTGNWLVVGTVAKTELLREVGGWRDYPVYEDFDLWQRCWIAGATVTPVPRAVYVAHSNQLGRNKSLSEKESRMVQYSISTTNLPDRDFGWLMT